MNTERGMSLVMALFMAVATTSDSVAGWAWRAAVSVPLVWTGIASDEGVTNFVLNFHW